MRRFGALAVAAGLAAFAVPGAFAATFTVTNTNDSAAGSLRQAVDDANASPGADSIDFTVSGTISLLTALPQITGGVAIDGGNNVRIDGGDTVGIGLDVLTVDAGSIRGLAITNFTTFGVSLNAPGFVVAGNLIGTDGSVTTGLGNNIGIFVTSAGATVGGPTAADRNVISGNGIGAYISATSTFRGNYVGTTADGNAALPNTLQGVFLDGPPSYSATLQDNVISANSGIGIRIQDGGHLIRGNKIGVGADGTTVLGNTGPGIIIESLDAGGNTIGGIGPDEGNVISNNGAGGVWVEGGNGTSIRGNSIAANTGLGINLSGAGTNEEVVAPAAPATASQSANTVTVSGPYSGLPSTTYAFDVYASTACDGPSGGEGATYLGTVVDTTDGSGLLNYGGGFPSTAGNPSVVTVTATTPGNSTSEFSACTTISGSPPPAGTLSGSREPAPSGPNLDTANVVDLTAAGTDDWAIWGIGSSTSLAPDVRKGANLIGDLTEINPNAVPLRGIGQYSPPSYPASLHPFTFSWTGGVPTEVGTTEHGGIQHNGEAPFNGTALDSGFSLTVPADTTPRTLRLWVSRNQATGRLRATLSDGSAAPLLDNWGGDEDFRGDEYTIDYQAGGPGETLTVEWVEAADYCSDLRCDSVTLHAVALSSGGGGGTPQPGPTFTVDQADDHDDGQCTVGDCTLREAINAANARVNDGPGTPDTIEFDGSVSTVTLPGGAPPFDVLPGISEQVVIDGGATNPVVDGSALGPGAYGFNIGVAAVGTQITNLQIRNVPGYGIGVQARDVSIIGNIFAGNGVAVFASLPYGNGGLGIGDNIIEAGFTPRPAIDEAAIHVINGAYVEIANNRITGYQGGGILATGTYRLLVHDNAIGTDLAGTEIGSGNTDYGIRLVDLFPNDRAAVSTNTIAQNGGKGIVIEGPTTTLAELSGNRISANGGQAIDLGDDGPDSPTPPAVPSGPNLNQNPAVMQTAVVSGGQTTIKGTYDERTVGGGSVQVEAFAGPPGATPQAMRSLGSSGLATAEGVGLFEFPIAGEALPGEHVTVTITSFSPWGAVTSELSNAVPAETGNVFVVDSTGDLPDLFLDGVCETDGGDCSLRAAIEEANATPNDAPGTPDRIEFAIPGDDTQALGASGVAGEMPPITDPVDIDGATQRDFQDSNGYVTPPPGDPAVALRGAGAPSGDAIVVTSDAGGSELSGLEVSFFGGSGIRIDGVDGVTVSDSLIRANGVNDFPGIAVDGDDNVIGPGNVVTGNGAASTGIHVFSGTGNTITRNSIFDNVGLGIDLGPAGHTANDESDGDLGANDLQNTVEGGFTAELVGSELHVAGLLDSLYGDYTVEVFANSAVDDSAFGEGERFLGQFSVFVNEGGTAEFDVALAPPLDPVAVGDFVSLTVTRTFTGDTSEFSEAVEVTQGGPIVVNSTADPGGDGVCDAAECTLREAIDEVNALPARPGGRVIEFGIGASGTQTIGLAGQLPLIEKQVAIDGATQAAYQVADEGLEPPADGVLAIALEAGSNDGLVLAPGSDGSVIRGLALYGFGCGECGGIAVRVQSDGNTLQGLYVGTAADGGGAPSSNENGIVVEGNANTIGGSGPGEGNLVSGNDYTGIRIDGTITGATGNIVSGNLIGTTPDGNAALPNQTGIAVNNAPNTIIGGPTAADGNVVHGSSIGVDLAGGSPVNDDASEIRWNNVGIGKDGTTSLPTSSAWAIGVATADHVVVADNAIGNGGTGIVIADSSFVAVQRNAVGTDRNGVTDQSNTDEGIDVQNNGEAGGNPHDITIGGSTANGNLVQGNSLAGIRLGGVDDSTVSGNEVRDNGQGGFELPGAAGISVEGLGNTIGPENLVEGNGDVGEAGIAVVGPPESSNANTITRNSIDGNAGLGIDLGGDGFTDNDIGGGPNGSQNFPDGLAGQIVGGSLHVTGALDSPQGTYTVELFASDAPDDSVPAPFDGAHGEGDRHLGRITVTTNASGAGTIDAYRPAVGVAAGQWISATTTGPDGTSEFSQAVQVAASGTTASVEISPEADTQVSEGAPDSNFGADTVADVYGGRASFCNPYSAPVYTLLRFDLSSVPEGAAVTDVRLETTTRAGYAQNGDPAHWAIALDDDSWDESAVTWNDRPEDGIAPVGDGAVRTSSRALGAADVWRDGCAPGGLDPGIAGDQAKVFPSTSDGIKPIAHQAGDFIDTVAEAHASPGDGKLSLQLWSANCPECGDLAYWARYYTKEAANAAVRPRLVVTYAMEAVLDSTTITTTTPEVEAAGKIPLTAVPPAAFLTNGSSSSRSAPVNDVPVNDVLLRDSPVNDIPVNDIGLPALAPELGDVLLSTIPLLRTGGWDRVLTLVPALATRPVQNVTLRDILELSDQEKSVAGIADLVLSDLNLSHSPLGAISAVAYSLGPVTLADLHLTGTTWCQVLAGPPINCQNESDVSGKTLLQLGIRGAPINDVPINDIPVNDVPINDIPVNDVPINDITVAGTPINDVPINDVPVNDVPVNDVPINDIPVNEIPVNDIPINEVPVNEIPVNDIPVNDVPVNEVPINEIPVNEIPVNEVPINEIPVNEVLLAGSPVNDIPVNDISQPATIFDPVPTGGTVGENAASLKPGVTLGQLRLAMAPLDVPDSVTLGSLTGGFGDTTTGDLITALKAITYASGTNPPTLAQIVGLIKNYTGTTPPKPTFGDLFDLLVAIDAQSSTINLTLTDLAHLLFGSDATLADLLAAVLASADLGWERLDLGGLGIAQYAPGAATAHYEVDVQIAAGSAPGGATGASFTVTLPPGFTYEEGSTRYEQISPPLDETGFPDPAVSGQTLTWTFDAPIPSRHRFAFDAFPDITLGTTSASVQASVEGGPDVDGAGTADVEVTENLEPSSLASPQAIAADEFVLSYLATSADGDVYSLPAPPAGSRVTILLSHLPGDFDLVVYGPGGQVLVPPVPGTPPLDGAGSDDPGTPPTHRTDALPPQTLADVPIDAGRTVVGVSANRGAQEDAVTFFSQGGATEYLIQVSGFNGVASGDPYMVRAEVLPPRVSAECAPRFVGDASTSSVSELPNAVPAGVNTVFAVNRQQLARIYGGAAADATVAAIEARLATLETAGFPSSILQVDAVQAVRDAYDGTNGGANWNACPSDPSRANDVVAAVGERIRLFKTDHPTVQYVVLVGTDDVIPFARLDDRTTLSNEDAYAGSFDPGSPIGGAFVASKLLSDDPYGTLAPIPFFDRQLYVPELGVGRLVETPDQIQAQLAAFTDGNLAGGTAVTTGYDFLTDGAQQVSDALAPVAATANETLFGSSWSAADLLAALSTDAGQPPALVSINAHADDSRFQAANHSLFTTTDILASSLTFGGRIVFSMGCHAGLNVSDYFLPPDRRKDWAQTFAGRGASVYLANTGFGYGDTDVVAYSEDLSARFAANLADGMTAGEALAVAKAGFQGDLALVGVYDEKAMAELTLYGLPMASIAGAGAGPVGGASGPAPLSRGVAEAGPGVAAAAAPLATTSPDPITGLEVEEFTVADPGLTGRRQSSADARGDWYRGRNGELVTHLRPIEPKATQKIEAPNAHGALVTGLTSVDVTPFDPLFARPVVDSAHAEPEIAYDDVAFPSKLQTMTRLRTFTGKKQKLVLAQGQFFSADPADGRQNGFQRLFTQIDGHVFTSPDTDFAPPTFDTINALKTGGTMHFTADVDPGGAGEVVKRVLVLFLGSSSGPWTPLDLTEGVDGRWTGSAPTESESVQYFVQAVDAHGNVAVSTNKGYYFAGEPAEPPATGQITIVPSGPQAQNGTYTGDVTVDVSGPDGVTLTVRIDGELAAPGAVVTTDGIHVVEVEGSNGTSATASFVIDTTPPTVEITSGPAAGSFLTSTTASFEFTKSEAAVSECRLDGAAFGACSSGVVYPGLGESEHTFHVRAVDAAGNVGDEVTRTWTVDHTKPVAQLELPASPSNDASPDVTFGADEPATFGCKLDDGAFAACTSAAQLTGLDDGSHTFRVRATDRAGNVSDEVAGTWVVDTRKPVASLTVPTSPSNDPSPVITFAADETPVTFVCKLDLGSFEPCTPDTHLSGLGDGLHTFRVKATDAAGNVSDEVAGTWVVDTRKPVVDLTVPTSPSNDPSPSVTFGADESPVTFECKLDLGSFAACTSAVQLAGLADGPHTFTVKATDGAGNTSDDVARTWTVDASAPGITTTYVGLTNPVAKNALLSVTVACTDATSGLVIGPTGCTASLTPPTGPAVPIATGVSVTLPTATEGLYTLDATARDNAGNTSTMRTTYTVGTSAAGMIVFARNGDIWIIKPDGTGLRQITSGKDVDWQPAKSPSGNRIVFARGPDDRRQLYRIDPDGRNLVGPLTNGGDNTAPAFSPDGTKLAFESTRAGSKERDIWTATYSPTASSLSSYVNATNAKGKDVTPAWSPNGARIAFSSNRAKKSEIFSMAANGSNQTQLTSNKRNDIDPSYSPDGTRIVFSSDQGALGPGNKQEIFTMNAATGGSQLRLTTYKGLDVAPFYLDATRIVFQTATVGGGGLAIVAPAGGTPVKIPNTIKHDASPG